MILPWTRGPIARVYRNSRDELHAVVVDGRKAYLCTATVSWRGMATAGYDGNDVYTVPTKELKLYFNGWASTDHPLARGQRYDPWASRQLESQGA